MTLSTHYNSQFGQDETLDNKVFNHAEKLFFVEIGSAEPIKINNTYFFESERQWTGLCVEARPSACDQLRSARKAEVVNACVSSTKGRSIFFDYGWLAGLARSMNQPEHDMIEKYNSHHQQVKAFWVDTTPIQDILDERNVNEVHLLAIDVEGAEIDVLSTLDLGRTFVHVVLIECNSKNAADAVHQFLGERFSFFGTCGPDKIYLNIDSPYFQAICSA